MLGLLFCAALAQAQDERRVDKLAAEIVSTQTPLSGEQIQQIEDYARWWVRQLADKASTDHQVAEARLRLLENMGPISNEEFFKPKYAAAVARALGPALDSERALVRLNAMIVASQMADPATVALVHKALEDPSPAIRYWAGKAATALGRSGRLAAAEQKKLVDLLAPAVVKEDSREVLKSLLMGLSGLDPDVAGERLLASLNDRVALHAASPAISPEPEFRALEMLFRRLMEGTNLHSQPLVPQAMAIACRYMVVSATALANDTVVSGQVRQEHQTVVVAAEMWLSFLLNRLAPNVSPPDSIDGPLKAQRWAEVLLLATRWKDTLKKPPFNFTDRDLSTQ